MLLLTSAKLLSVSYCTRIEQHAHPNNLCGSHLDCADSSLSICSHAKQPSDNKGTRSILPSSRSNSRTRYATSQQIPGVTAVMSRLTQQQTSFGGFSRQHGDVSTAQLPFSYSRQEDLELRRQALRFPRTDHVYLARTPGTICGPGTTWLTCCTLISQCRLASLTYARARDSVMGTRRSGWETMSHVPKLLRRVAPTTFRTLLARQTRQRM